MISEGMKLLFQINSYDDRYLGNPTLQNCLDSLKQGLELFDYNSDRLAVELEGLMEIYGTDEPISNLL